MWIADAEHSQNMDRRARDEFGIPVKSLMERAGRAVFNAVTEVLPEGGMLTVFCGRGNNGGDGLVVARVAQQSGYPVDCLIAAESADQLSQDAREQLERAVSSGVEPIWAGTLMWAKKTECIGCRDLIVDALLGTGAKCEVKGYIKEAIQAINKSGVPVIAVDMPSGIHCDTGEELGESVWALRTVTFGLPKPFLFQGIGLEHSGFWTIAEIGFPSQILAEPTEARLIEPEWVGSLLPERLRSSHKGENGHVLIVAGSRGMPGAATLAAKSALRAGAGLVTIASIPSVCETVSSHLPEVLLLPLPENNGVISGDAARAILERQSKVQGALFGPGLTHEAPVLDLLKRVWSEWRLPCVIDADALNAISTGLELPAADCVLTPHPGEMSRLLQSSIAEIQADRFATVRQAVQKFGQCVLLKGPYSIIGEPDQPMMVNTTGNPGLASGGMGDVLAGVAATLLAQELPTYYALSCAAYWHGLAGDLCAEEIGPTGFTASEVADRLPKARVKITNACDQN